MNHFALAVLFLFPAIPCLGQEQPSDPQNPLHSSIIRQMQPWLGLQLEKPDVVVNAHVKDLPAGVGFIVKSVDAGGPGETAGVKPMDILWMMGSQLVVNEAQLGTLLRLQKPGDQVELSLFRSGAAMKLTLTLGVAPAISDAVARNIVESTILPLERGPLRVVNVTSRLASFSNEQGRVILRKEGEGYKVTITSIQNQPIYDGNIKDDGDFNQVPEEWRIKVAALRRGLDHALESNGYNAATPRQPRPRVIPIQPQTAPKS